MSTLNLTCNARLLTVSGDHADFYSGSNEVDSISVTFDNDWSGYTKTAVFYMNEKNVYHVPFSGSVATIPYEAIATTGLLHIGVFGTNGTKRLTSSVLVYRVNNGAFKMGTTPSGVDIYTQLTALLDAKASKSDLDGLEARVAHIEQTGGGSGGGSGGGGSTVTVTPSLTSGTKVADITVNGVKKTLYAPTPTGGETYDHSALETAVRGINGEPVTGISTGSATRLATTKAVVDYVAGKVVTDAHINDLIDAKVGALESLVNSISEVVG